MSYLAAMQKLMSASKPALGTPAAKSPANVGVPPMQSHIEPPPYDAAVDPAWKGILDPNDHELRNFLSQLSPEERQMLLLRVGKMTGAGAPQPPSTSRAPGQI